MKHKKTQMFAIVILLLLCNKKSFTQLNPGMDAVYTQFNGQPTGKVAEVKKLGNQLTAPHNINWVPPAFTPPITSWTMANMGQIFGTAIDDAGNVYFSATAMYKGACLYAPYYAAQHLAYPTALVVSAGCDGYNIAGGAAGIYKADAANLNTLTVLSTTINATSGGGVGTNTIPNTGYCIGDLGYAKGIDKLYASNLEDGKIYCINLTSGLIDYVFDPFLADASGAQIANYGERIFGLAVNYEISETRLYYATLINNNQSEIWSVQLNATGDFVIGTNALEIIVPVSGSYTYVADIAFSKRGEMLVAEKGDPHNANVYQYFGKHNAWSLPQVLYVGSYHIGKNSCGGVDYGYSSLNDDNSEFACDTIIWTTSNAIDDSDDGPHYGIFAYGLMSHPINGFADNGLYLDEAFVVDHDTASNSKGGFGDVECYDWECPPEQTDICNLTDVQIFNTDSGDCCYDVFISNKYRDDYFSGISITSSNLSIASVSSTITWGAISFQSPTQVIFGDTVSGYNIPLDDPGLQYLATVCFTGSGVDVLTINFIGNAPQFDSICTKEVEIDGCGVPIDTLCAAITELETFCENGFVTMQFTVTNNSNFTMRGITLYSQDPNVVPLNNFIPIADLLPGQTSIVYQAQLSITNNDTAACFFFAACDINTPPGVGGSYPNFCCLDSILYCVEIPECGIIEESCNDAIFITPVKTDPVDCCYDLTLTNNISNIEYIEFIGSGGTQFSIFSGWSIIPPVSSGYIKIQAPGGGINPGLYPQFANFCLTGTSTAPHTVIVNYLDKNEEFICTDTLLFEDCELTEPTCANIINDSLYCKEGKQYFTFDVINNSPFTIYQIELRTNDNIFLNNETIIPAIPITPGNTSGSYTVSIDSFDAALDIFCVYLTAHNNIYDTVSNTAATQCCTDSLAVICLPLIDCSTEPEKSCCDFEDMIIPNGITPNNDGINDAFEITNTSCENISIHVYNRWGNIVFENDNYLNNWIGENNDNEKLPQGTYYIVIDLSNGSSKAMFIDIRY